ncbi:MAG: ECF transporter S component [Solobacterium sp.]|nr:ECF transporter S component [Solobacterium sp.]
MTENMKYLIQTGAVLAVMIGGFAMGPAAACAIEGVKILLNLLFQGTSTMFVGEAANFLIGCSFAVPAALIYRRNKTKNTALRGLLTGTVCMAAAGVFLNYFVLLPAYSFFYHLPIDTIISMGAQIFPFIDTKLKFVIACVTPFNLIKGFLISSLTVLLYKRISPLLH